MLSIDIDFNESVTGTKKVNRYLILDSTISKKINMWNM